MRSWWGTGSSSCSRPWSGPTASTPPSEMTQVIIGASARAFALAEPHLVEVTMDSTMQDFPLTITHLMRHGRAVHGRSEVITFEGSTSRRATFAEVGDRID